MQLSLSDYELRQRRIFENKLNHKFNTEDVMTELKLIKGEVSELELGLIAKDWENSLEELSDIAILCYGLAEIIGGNLDTEIQRKMSINEKRVYETVVGDDGSIAYKKRMMIEEEDRHGSL